MVGFTKKGTENYYFLTIADMIRKMKAFVVTCEATCARP